MAIDFKNGAVCSRFHSDGSGELLAAFQYSTDAEKWAADKVAEDADNDMGTTIVATRLYSGCSRMFKPKEKT